MKGEVWRVEADGVRILVVGRHYDLVATVERPEDAKVVAAAPELYALAELIVSLESSPMQRDYVCPQVQHAARALVKLVEGKPR